MRDLQQSGAIVLMGNHEKMMLDAYRNKEKAVERWFRNGAKQTLLSYGCAEEEAEGQPAAIRWTDELLDAISFVDKLPYYYETEDYIFVHAGVEPGVPLADCDPHKLVWIRGEFHEGYGGPKTVIFGHSRTKSLHGSDEVYFGTNSIIGIDGGCVYGGRSTAWSCHPGTFIISSKGEIRLRACSARYSAANQGQFLHPERVD